MIIEIQHPTNLANMFDVESTNQEVPFHEAQHSYISFISFLLFTYHKSDSNLPETCKRTLTLITA